jgi:glc operon protein GlcG
MPRFIEIVVTCALLATATLARADHDGTHVLAPAQTLTLDGARAVIAAAEAEATRHDAGGAIAVVDEGGHVLAVARIDGTFAAASAIATKKARSAALFRQPTRNFENAIKGGRTTLLANRELFPLQGGVPIVVGGVVVGAVGVAGASSAQQDDDFATAAAAAIHE